MFHSQRIGSAVSSLFSIFELNGVIHPYLTVEVGRVNAKIMCFVNLEIRFL